MDHSCAGQRFAQPSRKHRRILAVTVNANRVGAHIDGLPVACFHFSPGRNLHSLCDGGVDVVNDCVGLTARRQ
jgi:hypothetical protein